MDKTIETQLVAAALKLAEQGQWQDANLASIAKAADLPLSALFGKYRTKSNVLDLVEADLNSRVLDDVGEIDDTSSTRDRLFDLFMTRFETMNDNRDAFLSLYACSSSQSFSSLAKAKESISFLAECAGIDTSGLKGKAKALTLTYIYLHVCSTWSKDDSDDLAATMKVLDTQLSKAENWAIEMNNFNLNSFFGQKPETTEPQADTAPEENPEEGQEEAK